VSEKAAREDQEDAAAAGEEEPAAAPATSEAQHLRRLQTDNRLLNEASSAPIACAQRERERESEREREGERERVTSAKRRMRACLLAARNKKAHTNGMPPPHTAPHATYTFEPPAAHLQVCIQHASGCGCVW
jgi:hypothetical protein